MERTAKSVDEFLASSDGPRTEDVRLLDQEISKRMPGHSRFLYEGKFWGGSDQRIIGYGIVDYTNSAGDEVKWFVVGLAQQKNHISIYVNAVTDGAYLLRSYEDRLGQAKVGSASIAFDSIKKIDFDNLMALISEAAKAG